MPNPFHLDHHAKARKGSNPGDSAPKANFGKKAGPATGPERAKLKTYGPERTAKWQGLPGKTQGRTRDTSGTRKIKCHAKSEGV